MAHESWFLCLQKKLLLVVTVYIVKVVPDDSIDLFKAGLVAKGYNTNENMFSLWILYILRHKCISVEV